MYQTSSMEQRLLECKGFNMIKVDFVIDATVQCRLMRLKEDLLFYAFIQEFRFLSPSVFAIP